MSERPEPGERAIAAVFTPLKSGGLVEAVVSRIARAAETGVLPAGHRLPSESELATALGVSAVTIRDALAQLRDRGILRTRRGRTGGSFVAEGVIPSAARATVRLRELSLIELDDLALHYGAIAGSCAALAARRASEEDIRAIRCLIRPRDESAGAWRHSAAEFALEITAAAHSGRLTREMLRLQGEIGGMSLLPGTDPQHRRDTVPLRAAVVDAIASRDSGQADERMRTLASCTAEWLARARSSLS